jgi:AraC family transcriptional regulator, transcriptional activator of pobA
MKKDKKELPTLNSISEFHRILGIAKPDHPLISVINFNKLGKFPQEIAEKMRYNFYMICLIKKFNGKIKYGQNYFDFDEGTISFFSPGQILSSDDNAQEGWILIIHPDFLRGYPLDKTIKNYGFFSYEVYEALFLSEMEERMI